MPFGLLMPSLPCLLQRLSPPSTGASVALGDAAGITLLHDGLQGFSREGVTVNLERTKFLLMKKLFTLKITNRSCFLMEQLSVLKTRQTAAQPRKRLRKIHILVAFRLDYCISFLAELPAPCTEAAEPPVVCHLWLYN